MPMQASKPISRRGAPSVQLYALHITRSEQGPIFSVSVDGEQVAADLCPGKVGRATLPQQQAAADAKKDGCLLLQTFGLASVPVFSALLVCRMTHVFLSSSVRAPVQAAPRLVFGWPHARHATLSSGSLHVKNDPWTGRVVSIRSATLWAPGVGVGCTATLNTSELDGCISSQRAPCQAAHAGVPACYLPGAIPNK
jgi:hypothetical protein